MCDDVDVSAGDRVTVVTTGGGGWGDALLRDPELVRYDVVCGLVSTQGAVRDYGVVLADSDGSLAVDDEATASLRDKLRAERPALPMFDRGPYVAQAQAEGRYSAPESWADPDSGWLAVQP
jgi:N-methylhydantoinase B